VKTPIFPGYWHHPGSGGVIRHYCTRSIDVRRTVINRMLGDTIGPVVGRPDRPATREEPAMFSPVFPVPLIPPQPARPGPAVPLPRDPPGADLVFHTSLDSELDDDDTPLAVAIEERGEIYVVVAEGEVDIATAPLLGRALEAGLAGGRPIVLVDLRRVSFVDCTGIGLLTQARSRAHQEGTRMRILAGRAVARTAALLDLTAALGLHEPA
jgi:anti-anti-sigma factor